MEHKTWYDEQHGILRLQVVGEYSSQEARDLGKTWNELLQGKPYRQLVVDLSQAGRMESRETRKIQNDCLKEAEITDIVFVGASSATRMIAKVLVKLSSLNAYTEFFRTNDEAIKWIKDRRGS